MTPTNTSLLARLPSLKSLLVFNVAGKHLNLVRAAEELFLTQGALSRQLKSLEDHLGVTLFERGPRGLRFTQEGELLYDFTYRAFELLGTGLGRLVLEAERQTLVLSAARSFAVRTLAPRLPRFLQAHPWVDLRIDIHRYFVDLETSGADISIRLGQGDWPSYHVRRLTDDSLFPVCSPGVAQALAQGQTEGVFVLHNAEREYVDDWNRYAGDHRLPEGPALSFNDSATMLCVAESGQGIAVTRASLVGDALDRGMLVRPYPGSMVDGLDYYAVWSDRAARKPACVAFLQWLEQTFPVHEEEGGGGL